MNEAMRTVMNARFVSMVGLLDKRLSSMDENPWESVKVEELSDEQLAHAVEALRELLYSPPPKGK